MSSQDIRWIIAGLFVAFLAVVVLSDLIKRKPKKPKTRQTRPRGFRRAMPPAQIQESARRSSWKSPSRR